jgi:MYXO-CTERM domain-containing protein
MSVLLLLTSLARAAPLVLGVGPATALGLEGRHARPFIADDSRVHVGYGRSGSFRAVPLGADLTPLLVEDRVIVPGHGRFVDHMMVPCGGGTFLHVASGRIHRPDDSAWATPVGTDLVAGTTRTIVRESTSLATNDPAAVCAGPVVAVGLAGAGEPGDVLPPDWLYVLDEEFFAGGEVAAVADASVASRMTGNSMLWDDAAGALRVFGMEPDVGLVVATFDAALAPMEVVEVWPELPDDQYPYWAQGAAPAGGAILLAHMVRGDGDGFAQDTGQVALTVLGPDLVPLETWQLTELSPPDGAMRPGIARVGTDLALVTFDVGGRVWAVEVDLDGAALDALGAVDGGDTGGAMDTAPTAAGDGRAAPGRSAPADGGCVSVGGAPAGAILPLLSLFALARRRRIPR